MEPAVSDTCDVATSRHARASISVGAKQPAASHRPHNPLQLKIFHFTEIQNAAFSPLPAREEGRSYGRASGNPLPYLRKDPPPAG